jgi:glycosyltransferase involved in cell wall biosynthesis
LGTPIHPRGIFNYSVALAEILKAAGASVDLVVEGSANFSLEDRFGDLVNTAPDAVNSVRLSEIHRYFNQGQFGFRWGYRTAKIKFLASRGRSLIAAWLALREQLGYRRNIAVRNDLEQIDFVPAKSEHLNLFDRLIVKRSFYSASMSRANLGLPPPSIDASGYDLAIVDTPHFIKVLGIAPERMLTVLHDLIPLRDPTMDLNWRNLFMRKLEATLAMRANMVFVSRYTQKAFHAAFPRHAAPREFVVHPSIRRKLMSDAERVLAEESPEDAMPEMTRLSAEPATRAVGERKMSAKQRRRRSTFGGNPIPPGYNPSLPFFVTATSDEPRKNIETVVRAFYQSLRGRANIVILGEINSGRYDPGPEANVYFPGYVSDTEKIAYFRNARGVVFASLSEGFGIPLIEGAVMGRPVLCSDIEVFREVAGVDAFYFDPRSPASLAGAVREALADPDAAHERAEALRQAVLQRFSQEAVGASVQAALVDLGLASDSRVAHAKTG